jgi:hypothetical protein
MSEENCSDVSAGIPLELKSTYKLFNKLPSFLTFRVSQNDIINDNLLKFGSIIG